MKISEETIGSNSTIKLFDCDFAVNSKVDEYLKTAVKSSEDGDFDEDEEEKEEGAARKMKLSNFQQLLCGFKPKVSEAI